MATLAKLLNHGAYGLTLQRETPARAVAQRPIIGTERSMTITAILSVALFWGSTHAIAPSNTASDEYAKAVNAVEQALLEINTDPARGIASLREALAELHEHAPQLAADAEALELRTMAELALARALLASGDPRAAAAVVDAALEGLGDARLPVDQLGPSLGALVEERQQALRERGQARLRVACAVPCRVYVNERESNADEPDGAAVPLGAHRVWIESDEASPLKTTLTLRDADAAITLAYPEVPTVAPAPQVIESEPDRRQRRALARQSGPRVAPRWFEVSALVLGGAAVVAGAVLWALDDTCPGGADRNDLEACPQMYDTRTAGIALVSAGAGTALLGGVLLGIDAARLGDRRGHELALTWTTRF